MAKTSALPITTKQQILVPIYSFLIYRTRLFAGMWPRSGLWQRKDGYRGRKIKKPPPTIQTVPREEYYRGAGSDNAWPGYKCKTVICDNFSEGKRGRRSAGKRKVDKNGNINW